MRLTGRLNAAERKVNGKGELPQLIVVQHMDNPELYTGNGRQYTAAEIEAMEETHEIIRIIWVDSWRDDSPPPADDDDATHIKLTWGDDD